MPSLGQKKAAGCECANWWLFYARKCPKKSLQEVRFLGTNTTGRPGDCGMEMNRAHPLRPCVFACFNRSGSTATWDHFRCTVEASPGHIR